MTDKALETWAWVLIYGGMLAATLGWFVAGAMALPGTLLMAAGGVGAAAGALMIWLRSRRKS